jgi:DNA-cytosine methyltransferase
MNVLSLFDGISGAQQALKVAGIKVDKYFSSEIDKHAISITQKNFPNTVQLGDVTKVSSFELEESIDLLIGGSPCQGFSFAGKQLNFKDPRSKLFFEYVRILRDFKPKFFLLENVKMKKKYQDIISDYLGVAPIEINSNLITAQNRKRLYWTNLPEVSPLKKLNIKTMDILEYPGIPINYSSSMREGGRIDYRYTKGNKVPTLTATGYGIRSCILIACTVGSSEDRVLRETEKFGCLTASMYKGIRAAGRPFLAEETEIGKHIDECEKTKYRMLTPIECERLQTFPDNYTNCVSKTQRYKALGNSFTVEVIAHILKHIEMPRYEDIF